MSYGWSTLSWFNIMLVSGSAQITHVACFCIWYSIWRIYSGDCNNLPTITDSVSAADQCDNDYVIASVAKWKNVYEASNFCRELSP
jgi:hypothetical protein